ncbi:Fumarylacetoacetate (FAA) hydrolase [Frankia canadensis]|uniref:Fumarylacetoacetate (FAA) hydrolase n=1 Tax=Frankia canadensis TaxID=1836972 RepID=A0A2I2KNY9_9ACTN|nr:fumarylacetoacetate hydrolase family protein [Frankia canadensis]SNQ47384.1 Fumarylacetoacetate (FAA) hydrolase [Frankia canadensis]SOU54674.1 Fumarylacetoacetate (FAA) hydrolase [Frankia canadensis]
MRFVGMRDGHRVDVGVLVPAGGNGPAPSVARLTDVDDFYADLAGWTTRARTLLASPAPGTSTPGALGPGALGPGTPNRVALGPDGPDGVTPYRVTPNSLAPNSLTPNSLAPNSLAPDGVSLAPPVPAGARILGMGLNYHAHAAEIGSAPPKRPPLFGRWTASLSVDGTPVPVPPGERGLDWEGELAVVVGARLTDVDEDTAARAVFGYAVFNDLSARRAQGASAQWTLGKNADRSGPMGPVVTADEVGDPAAGLRLITRVNGEIVQDGDTSDMIFSIGHILSFVSRTLTLNPGDVLITGTPAGVGYVRTPPRYLVPGDVVEVEIDRVGRLRTPIVDASARP